MINILSAVVVISLLLPLCLGLALMSRILVWRFIRRSKIRALKETIDDPRTDREARSNAVLQLMEMQE